jgi:hypothetical protein
MESKQTSREALVADIEALRAVHAPGEHLKKKENHIIARITLHSELGEYADHLPVYHLDQEKRDRLLVHARQDAAEALCHASSLMDEVHQLKAALRSMYFTALGGVAGVLLLLWWKLGA